jgi:hypothetical protein
MLKRFILPLTVALARVAALSPARADEPAPVPPGAAAVVAAYQKLKFLRVVHYRDGGPDDWLFEGVGQAPGREPVTAQVHCPAGTTPAEFRDYWLRAVMAVVARPDPNAPETASAVVAPASPYVPYYSEPSGDGGVSGGRSHYVGGYYRKNGTYVHGYYRK